MQSVSELGHIWLANLNYAGIKQGDPSIWWQNINLLSYEYGAYLLDVFTVRPTNAGPKSVHGVVAINTRNEAAIRALFYNAPIGIATNSAYLKSLPGNPNNSWKVDYFDDSDAAFNKVVEAILDRTGTNEIWSFQDLFEPDDPTSRDEDLDASGPVAAALRGLVAPDSEYPYGEPNDIAREGAIRHITELISFRQNIFTIVLAAQAYGKDQESVVAEARAVAVLYRDSYTGRYFVRSFKWLD